MSRKVFPPYVSVCVRDVISEFNSKIEGSHASCVLLYVLEVVCMWSVSGLLGCCVCLREE